MIKCKIILFAFIISALVIDSYAQISHFISPLKLSKKEIPSSASADIRDTIERLYSSNPMEVERAITELGDMGTKASPALPFLIEILGYPNMAAVYRNGTVKEVNPGLSSAKAIGKIGNDKTAGTLVIRLKDAIKKSLDKAKEQPLMDQEQMNMGKNQYSGQALTQAELEKMDPIFVIDYDLNDVVIDVPNIAQALIAMKNLSVKPLTTLLEDENSNIISAAAEILGEIGDKKAIGPLIDALEGKDSIPRKMFISSALAKITGQNFRMDTAKWQEWWKNNKDKIESR